jgi:hypothetical protein
MHQVRANDLNCHLAIKSRALVSQVDLTHTPDINAADQIIVAKMVQRLLPANGQTMLFFHVVLYFSVAGRKTSVG